MDDRVNQLLDIVRLNPGFSSRHVTLSLYREADVARIVVADDGPGIPEEHLRHLFERFYRIDKARSRSRGGTGLGLAIVQWIAVAHGGDVTVESAPGAGSAFTVTLPLAPGDGRHGAGHLEPYEPFDDVPPEE